MQEHEVDRQNLLVRVTLDERQAFRHDVECWMNTLSSCRLTIAWHIIHRIHAHAVAMRFRLPTLNDVI